MNNFGAIIFLTIIFLLSLFLSWYVFQAFKTLIAGINFPKTAFYLAYWLIFGSYIVYVMVTMKTIVQEGEISAQSQAGLNALLTVSITQLTIVLFLFGEDLYRGVQGSVNFLTDKTSVDKSYLPGRRKFISQLALIVAAFPFLSFVYGIAKGKYNFKVIKETLYFEDLPEAFDGFKITQISDIHAGSFRDYDAVQRGIELAKAQNSDLFVFTGDLVNRTADEIDPLLEKFKHLKAPYGQYSILGNHDYGDYLQWPSPEDKIRNFNSLKAKHAQMDYRLLLDEHVTIEKGGEKIQLIGVENWGVGFKSKGDLEKALQ